MARTPAQLDAFVGCNLFFQRDVAHALVRRTRACRVETFLDTLFGAVTTQGVATSADAARKSACATSPSNACGIGELAPI